MRAVNTQLRSTAYHEAGHAVAAHYLGVKVGNVTIVPDGNAVGSAQNAPTVSRQNLKAYEFRTSLNNFEGETSALRTAVISLAGVVAQRAHAPRSVRNYHWRADYEQINLLARKVCCEDEKEMEHWYRRALRRTEQLINWRWPAVEALAAALIEKRKLSGYEAVAAIQSAYQLPKAEQLRIAKLAKQGKIS